jgi:hypothetical protein
MLATHENSLQLSDVMVFAYGLRNSGVIRFVFLVIHLLLNQIYIYDQDITKNHFENVISFNLGI